MKFAGQCVVVTGAASGIGAALTHHLVKEEARIVALDVDEGGLAQRADEASAAGGELTSRVVDLTDREATGAALADIEKKTGIPTLWINAAGVPGVGDFTTMDPDEFDHVLQVNLHAVIQTNRMLLEPMERAGRGTIVNVASLSGHIPAPFMTAYCTAKFGLVGFTRSLRAELEMKESPIRAVLASPGFVDTPMISRGEEMGFPQWLSFLLSKPDTVAREILTGLRRDRAEIFPAANGRWLKRLYSLLPQTTVRSSKVLLTRRPQDLLFNDYHWPHRS